MRLHHWVTTVVLLLTSFSAPAVEDDLVQGRLRPGAPRSYLYRSAVYAIVAIVGLGLCLATLFMAHTTLRWSASVVFAVACQLSLVWRNWKDRLPGGLGRQDGN